MRKMRRGSAVSVLALGVLALAGCAVAPPEGPSVMVMPGKGKDLAAFQADDAVCRQYADSQIGISPAQAASKSFAANAVVGTVLGAATGAAIGAATGNPAAGAAIGAGGGAALGSITGLGAASASGHSLQYRYDIGYMQCMSAKGNDISPAENELAARQRPYVVAYPPSYYIVPGGYYAPGPYYGPRWGFRGDWDWDR
jgi:Glycine-zipper domain